MTDINYSMAKAYYQALSTIPGIEVFNGFLPEELNPDNYIVFYPVSNDEHQTFTIAHTNFYMRVSIYTKEDGLPGETRDSLAAEVFNRIYPHPSFNLTAENCQVVSTYLSSDRSDEINFSGQTSFKERHLDFRHRIKH